MDRFLSSAGPDLSPHHNPDGPPTLSSTHDNAAGLLNVRTHVTPHFVEEVLEEYGLVLRCLPPSFDRH